MRALNYLAQSHPEEFKELLEDGKEEAARRWDSLDVLFKKQVDIPERM